MSISQPLPSALASGCMMHPHEQDNRPPRELRTLVDIGRWRAQHQADAIAFTFLEDGEEREANLTYAQLDLRARAVAAALEARGKPGDRVLILQEPGIDYIVSLFGCMYARQIAVPVYPPELLRLQTTLPRLQAIARDAGATLMLSSRDILGTAIGPLWSLSREAVLAVEEIPNDLAKPFHSEPFTGNEIALLQYTSGSTGVPRGVALTHGNLIANLDAAYLIWDVPDAVAVFWLPPYHDMGLIGGILLPVFGGRRVVLMSPKSFLQRPARLLHAIHRYQGTSSGSPNFGYELCVRKITEEDCVGLDLSTWRIAVVGAEPVRASTMERFAEKFAPYGFNPNSVTPAYGMAESTVVISGKRKGTPPLYLDFDPAALQRHWAIPVSRTSQEAPPTRLVGCGPMIPGGEAIIVDPSSLRKCAAGEVGEIWVRGPSVAAGYWNQPELSEQIFRAKINGGNDVGFLRTGDLGFEASGQLFVNGRLKELIILAGRNYYPHDIEKAFQSASSALRADCGVAFSVERDNEERLVIVQEVLRPQKLDLEQVLRDGRVALAEAFNLSPYAIVLVASGSLPKTSSGKLRRSACKELFEQNELRSLVEWRSDSAIESKDALDAEAPLPGAESAMALLWQDVLTIPHVHRHDHFFHLGGHSLSVVQLMQAIQEQQGISVPLHVLFDHPTLAEFVAALPQTHIASPTSQLTATLATSGPLTRAQQRFWMLNALHQQGTFSQVPLAIKFAGMVDASHLQSALQALVDQHPALRTRFILHQGKPHQEVLPKVTLPFQVVDLTELDPAQREQHSKAVRHAALHDPFDFEQPPLFRAVFFIHEDARSELLLVWHHIVCDGWSAQWLLQELASHYQSAVAGSAKTIDDTHSHSDSISLVDFAVWEQSTAGRDLAERDLGYWNERLKGAATVLELPTDAIRGTRKPLPSQTVSAALDTDLSSQIHQLGERLGITDFMVYLAAWQCLLGRYANTQDLVVGVPTANRPSSSLQRITGCFINTVPIRARLDESASVAELLQKTRQQVLGDLEHSGTPFEKIVESIGVPRSLERMPLTQHLFLYQPKLDFANQWGHATATDIRADYSSLQAFDLSLVVEQNASTEVRLVYPPALFDPSTIDRMLHNYVGLLKQFVASTESTIADLAFASPAERELIEAWNSTERRLPNYPHVAAWVAAQAQKTPNAIAVSDEQGSLTYAELDRHADRIARHLAAMKITQKTPVGLCIDRSRYVPASMLGIWKAGGAYVPLDPNYPASRLEAMIEDAKLSVVICDATTVESLSHLAVTTCDLEQLLKAEQVPNQAISCDPASEDRDPLAYVMYTSGSTGQPKGVMVTQKSIINLLQSFAREPGFTARDSLLALTTISFDISVLELFLPLVCGGRVVIAADQVAQNTDRVEAWLSDPSITWVQGTPSTFRLLLAGGWCPQAHQTLLCGGEPVTPELAKQLKLNGAEVWNVYGPTETTVWSTLHRIDDALGHVPIGHPLDNTTAWIVDSQGRLAPIGVPGNLYLGGVGVARGYWNQPQRTSERFIDETRFEFLKPELNPLSDAASRDHSPRLYRTGDQARWRADGTLQFLARDDRQVKVRGHRIELGDVEAHLEQHPQVHAAAVIRVEQSCGAALVAYCVTSVSELDGAALREYARAQLPEYMVPAHVVILMELPRTPAGKVDYKSLPAIDATACESHSVPPRTPLERELAALWAEVLERNHIGIHDNFFDLGGHSLRAAQLFARLRDSCGYGLPLRELYQRPTIAQQAEWIVHHQLQSVDQSNAEDLLLQLEQMSEAEVLKMLQSPDATA